MQAEDGLHTTKNKKESENLTYANRETDRSKLKSSAERINLTISILQSDDQKDRTLKQKSKNSREVVSREMMSFKIMKLVYNDSIYTKTF